MMRIKDDSDPDSSKKIRVAVGIEDALHELGYDLETCKTMADYGAEEIISSIVMQESLTKVRSNFPQYSDVFADIKDEEKTTIQIVKEKLMMLFFLHVHKFTQLFEIF